MNKTPASLERDISPGQTLIPREAIYFYKKFWKSNLEIDLA